MTRRLVVNPILCSGHGVCAELVPELVEMDPWGYPLVARAELDGELALYARRAVAACPALALMIGRQDSR